MTQPDPPSGPVPSPEGQLISLVRQSRTPSMSVRAAARLAGISETHWRHVEAGYESKGGMKIPVGVSAKTAARMAWVVGISPARLGQVRPAAGLILAEIVRNEGNCVIPMGRRGNPGPPDVSVKEALSALAEDAATMAEEEHKRRNGPPRQSGESAPA